MYIARDPLLKLKRAWDIRDMIRRWCRRVIGENDAVESNILELFERRLAAMGEVRSGKGGKPA